MKPREEFTCKSNIKASRFIVTSVRFIPPHLYAAQRIAYIYATHKHTHISHCPFDNKILWTLFGL